MMKKILLILFILPALSCYGQRKISNMTETSTVNSDAVIPVVQSGANYKATKENLQKEVVSTAATNTSNITQLTNNTSGITGFTMTTDGDTVIITYGDESWKLLAVGVEEEDTTPPTVTAVEVGNLSSDTVVVTMSEAMDTGSSNSSFTFTEDGNAYGIGTPIFHSNDTIKIPLDSVAEAEKDYLLSYSRPGVDDYQDVAGNKLSSFTNFSVVNNVASASSIYAYMLFENNDDDEMGVMTFTWDGTEGYRTDGSPPQGTYSTNTASGGSVITNETHDLGSLLTFTGWFNGGGGTPRYLLALDGVDIWFDYTNGAQYLTGTIGGQSFSSSLISDTEIEWKWGHLAVTYDGVNGYARTYVNGVNVSSDSIVGTYADMDGYVSISCDNGANDFYGDYDDVQIYKSVLSDSDIAWIMNNPGEPVGGFTDPPIPSDSVEVLYEEDFEDFYITTTLGALSPSGIHNDSISANFENFVSLGSDDANDPDKADNADIVEVNGSNWLLSWYLEGQCCSGAASDAGVANGGTGVHITANITNASTTYNEVYTAFKMCIKSDFENSNGFKIPGVRVLSTSDQGSSRLMVLDWSGATGDLNPAYYTAADWTRNSSTGIYETTWGVRNTQSNSKDYDLPKGDTLVITIRSVLGTERGEDGRVEFFIDGVYFGEAVSSVPFRDTGDEAGWILFSFLTIMGGDNTAYTSPKDQWILYDDIKIFRFTDGADVVRGSTPSAIGRDISGTLRSLGYNL